MYNELQVVKCFRIFFAHVVVTALLASILLPSTKPAVAAEAHDELALLTAFTSYYRTGTSDPYNLTSLSAWRYAIAPGNVLKSQVASSYYGTVCNTVAVSAIVKNVDSANTNIDWPRLRDLLMDVRNEYYGYAQYVYPGVGTIPANPTGWGEEGNEYGPLGRYEGVVGYSCTLATALLWQQIDPSTGQYVLTSTERQELGLWLRALVNKIGNFRGPNYYNNLHDANCGDTAIEIASADAAFLAAMSQFDRSNSSARHYLEHAQGRMEWAYTKLNEQSGCARPTNGVDYVNTVTNHLMYPHPNYALAIVNDTARALLPWLAQGVHVQNSSSGIQGISALSPTAPTPDNLNRHLYGGFIGRPYDVYNRTMRYVHGSNLASAPVLATNTTLGFIERTYKSETTHIGQPLGVTDSPIDFQSKWYMGRRGVSDWGIGVDLQNAALMYPAFLDHTYYPSLQNGYTNYLRALSYEKSHAYHSYLPPNPNPTSCSTSDAPDHNWDSTFVPSTWNGQFLTATCEAVDQLLVPFHEPWSKPSIAKQVNTHFFLNAFKAMNHAVSYLIMKGVGYTGATPYWPPNGKVSTLPNFSNTALLSDFDEEVPNPKLIYMPAIAAP